MFGCGMTGQKTGAGIKALTLYLNTETDKFGPYRPSVMIAPTISPKKTWTSFSVNLTLGHTWEAADRHGNGLGANAIEVMEGQEKPVKRYLLMILKILNYPKSIPDLSVLKSQHPTRPKISAKRCFRSHKEI